MPTNEVLIKRAKFFYDMVNGRQFSAPKPLQVEYCYNQDEPIPYSNLETQVFKPINIGDTWGELWGSAWFRMKATVPPEWKGQKVAALVNLGGEGCVWRDGRPWQGITNRNKPTRPYKRLINLIENALGNEKIELLIEAGANWLFGEADEPFILHEAGLVTVDSEHWKLLFDIEFLHDLVTILPQNSVRFKRILHGLNDAFNVYANGKGIKDALTITNDLLSVKGDPSDLTIHGIGHAHLDLGWLWPVRETIRKGGRTFSYALRLIEQYDSYIFGASQPQLYEWIKIHYPPLYDEIKKAIQSKRWVCLGAMWVEADTNITSGESLVRQCLYGKRFFEKEFGVKVHDLWLPDVFGYSAALPQILRGFGIDIFVTQKISWNDTNKFPHHTFYWYGIDGTPILSHFLPSDTYNASNLPTELRYTQENFQQAHVSDSVLHAFGVGDGGGGPSWRHVERGIRATNCNGVPRFKFSSPEQFYSEIQEIPQEKLPVWNGELYLELHRGTYTTQAQVKKYNRLLEQKLRNLEFLASLNITSYPSEHIESIWKRVLLNQFHDILPGSSIGWVYKDAIDLYKNCNHEIDKLTSQSVNKVFNVNKNRTQEYILFNTLSWNREEIIPITVKDDKRYSVYSFDNKELPSYQIENIIYCKVNVPSMGYTIIKITELAPNNKIGNCTIDKTATFIENDLIKVNLSECGEIISIYDKENNRELLSNKANEILLYEDRPVKWDAWDIDDSYRNCHVEKAVLISRKIAIDSPLLSCVRQEFTIGNSKITQHIEVYENSKEIRIRNKVNWNESHKMLRVHAQTSIFTNSANFEIQYGTIERTTKENTSWDQAMFEVCGHRFADLSEARIGMALLNDSKYGYRCKDGSIELTLLRSPTHPDRKADIGEHEFTYSYYPHSGNLVTSDTRKKAHQLNSPILILSGLEIPSHPEKSYFTLSNDSIVLEVVKKAEDCNKIVLRLYEADGLQNETELTMHWPIKSLFTSSMDENPLQPILFTGNKCILKFRPFEIKTLLMDI